jgi:hypothetical protein
VRRLAALVLFALTATAPLTAVAAATQPEPKLDRNQRKAVETLRRVNQNARDGRYDLVYDELHPVQRRWMTKEDFAACMPAVRAYFAAPQTVGNVPFPALDPFPELGKVRRVRKPDTARIDGTVNKRARSVVIEIEHRQPDQDRFSFENYRVFRSGKRWTYTVGGALWDQCETMGFTVGIE